MLMLSVTITSVLTKFIEGRAFCILLFIKVLLFCSYLSARPAMIHQSTASILIIDDFHPVFIENLQSAGLPCRYEPGAESSQLLQLMQGYPIIAVRSKLDFNRQLIDQLPDLKCIARGGAGMDNIDEDYARSKGITLLNAPEGNCDAVAEHAIGLLLSLSKKIVAAHLEVSEGQWNREKNRGWEIGNKTIGIIGYGHTGSAFARKLSGFGCKVLAYDKYKSGFSNQYATECSLEQLLENSDVISFHVPLTNETNAMLNQAMISQMKDQVTLLNTSRGKVVQLEAVLIGIRSGKIRSFASDVLENENLKSYTENEKAVLSDLMASNQAVITPHVAGWSSESYYKIGKVLSEKLLDYTTKVKNI